MISSVQQIKFSQLVVDFSQRDSNLTVLYLFCKEIRTKFYIIETSIWLNHVEYIQSMLFSVWYWRKWHGHEKIAGAFDTHCNPIKDAPLVLRIFYQLLLLLYSAMPCPRFDLPQSRRKIAFTRKKLPMSNERRAENESIYWIWCVTVCLDFIPGPYCCNQPM